MHPLLGHIPAVLLSFIQRQYDARLQIAENQTISRDPANILAVVVLAAMVIIIGVVLVRKPWVVGREKGKNNKKSKKWMMWAMPVLALAGTGVAIYLSFVEVNSVQAVCGPIGNCNVVQQSPYARLFGILPVGVLGLVGYIAILAAWGLKQFGKRQMSDIGGKLLLALTTFGLLFSIYLTFLEPFVIGATCLWCISTAVIMTILFWLSAETVQF